MTIPILKKYPAEIFGFPYTDNSNNAKLLRRKQWCPFLKATCKKPRKSEPHVKVGICSVGYRLSPEREYEPVIICPHRFDLDVVFDAVITHELGQIPREEILWASEVSIGTAGSVDFVAAHIKTQGGVQQIQDFICLELQAAGTTGTPWQAFLEYKKTGRFMRDSYNYGINWANEFAKTMMQQAYKKGKVVEHWGKKIIFAIQDVGLEYLSHHYNTADLREACRSDPVHFYTFKMLWDDVQAAWKLELGQRLSTTTSGIAKILAGQKSDQFLTVSEFIKKIKRKLPQR